MAKFSKKVMGKEVGDAATYAEPHDMSGKVVKISAIPGKPSEISNLSTMRMSVGNYNSGESQVKTTGIVTRGNGCATKGTMARGPMA